jgi:hypothetical protein
MKCGAYSILIVNILYFSASLICGHMIGACFAIGGLASSLGILMVGHFSGE